MYKTKLDDSLLNEKLYFEAQLEAFEEGGKKMSEEKVNEIDWTLFESKYVQFPEGEPIDLTIKSWSQVEIDYNDEVSTGIKCDVIRENGREVDKVLRTGAKRLISALRPHIQRAEKMNTDLKVRILRTGQGYNTSYSVRPLA